MLYLNLKMVLYQVIVYRHRFPLSNKNENLWNSIFLSVILCKDFDIYEYH